MQTLQGVVTPGNILALTVLRKSLEELKLLLPQTRCLFLLPYCRPGKVQGTKLASRKYPE